MKSLVFAVALFPAVFLAIRAALGKLSANPIGDVTELTGIWTLRFLVLTLTVTPLRQLTGWNEIIRYRRMIGLFAFFYGFAHMLTYVWLDQFFSIPDILHDVAKRRFITAGALAFLSMVPLAATSTDAMIRRFGGKRWQKLHRLIYLTAICGVIHFIWLVKADLREPLIYAGCVAVFLGYRLFKFVRRPRG